MQPVPIMGTIVPIMGTGRATNGPAEALFGKTRRRVLSLLFTRPDESYYLRRLAREAGPGLGAVQREMEGLSRAGIVTRTVRDNQVYYQANRSCPVFGELRAMIVKTSGVADVIREALAGLAGRLETVFIFGSAARGEEGRNSDIDLMVVGKAKLGEVVAALGTAQVKLAREINPTVYPPGEFRRKLEAGNHFLSTVMKGRRIHVLGTDRQP